MLRSDMVEILDDRPCLKVQWDWGDAYLWLKNHGGGSVCLEHEYPNAKWAKKLDKDLLHWWDILAAYEHEHQTNGEFADLTNFDWQAFNAKGIALAKRLKQNLGDEAHVEYASSVLANWAHKTLWSSEEETV